MAPRGCDGIGQFGRVVEIPDADHNGAEPLFGGQIGHAFGAALRAIGDEGIEMRMQRLEIGTDAFVAGLGELSINHLHPGRLIGDETPVRHGGFQECEIGI